MPPGIKGISAMSNEQVSAWMHRLFYVLFRHVTIKCILVLIVTCIVTSHLHWKVFCWNTVRWCYLTFCYFRLNIKPKMVKIGVTVYFSYIVCFVWMTFIFLGNFSFLKKSWHSFVCLHTELHTVHSISAL